MDKRGARILLGCLLCTLMVFSLFLVAFYFIQPTCELIFIQPARLAALTNAHYSSSKPIRSHDKTLLIKIGAHLEYLNGRPGGQDSQLAATQVEWTPAQAGNNPTPIQGQVHAQASSSQNPPTTGNAPPQQAQFPQQPQVPVQQQQQQQHQPLQPLQQQQQQQQQQQRNPPVPSLPINTTLNINTGSGPVTSSASAIATPTTNKERRFLPIEPTSVDTPQVDPEGRFRYKIRSNCTTIVINLVKRTDKIYIDAMSLELKVPARHKKSCDLQLPTGNGSLLSAEVQTDGIARFRCFRPLRLACYNGPSKQQQQQPQQQHQSQHLGSGSSANSTVFAAVPVDRSTGSGAPLVELLLHQIEFEIAAPGASESFRVQDFSNGAGITECGMSGVGGGPIVAGSAPSSGLQGGFAGSSS